MQVFNFPGLYDRSHTLNRGFLTPVTARPEHLSCGVELASHEKLRWKKAALENENHILQQRLFEAGQVSQTNEIRMRFLDAEREDVAILKETIHNYQKALANQREELDSEKRNHALTAQSSNHESSCYKATDDSLDQERSYFRGFI